MKFFLFILPLLRLAVAAPPAISPPMPAVSVSAGVTNHPAGCDCIRRSTNGPVAWPYRTYTFTASAYPGALYRVTSSTDMVTWVYFCDVSEPEFTGCITNGLSPRRFYRVRSLYPDGRATTDPGGEQYVRQ